MDEDELKVQQGAALSDVHAMLEMPDPRPAWMRSGRLRI